MIKDGGIMEEQEGKLIDFKDFNWKTASDEKIIRFGSKQKKEEGKNG